MSADGVARDFDAERQATYEQWQAAAPGWSRQHRVWGSQSAAVSSWMIDALELEPGQRLLELAAGTGEVGFLALPRIQPGGTLISSDGSDAMLEVARARAAEQGLSGVEFRVLNGESLDLEVASVDAVLCRWGYMLMSDPDAALRETRRVLRNGGRVSLAVWDALSANPWFTIPVEVLRKHGLTTPPPPGAPGPFSMADPERVRSALAEAGFSSITVDAVDVPRDAPEFDSWWATHLDLSGATRNAFARADEEQTLAIETEVARRFAPYTAADGSLSVPGRTLVAAAEV